MKSSWWGAGGVDNGPIGSAQFLNYLNSMSLSTEKQMGGHYLYNDYDGKAYFKFITKYFGDEDEGKMNFI